MEDQSTGVKIDKRTREYKMQQTQGEVKTVLPEDGYEFVPCFKCGGSGKGEGCMEQGGFVRGLCPECCGHKGTNKKKAGESESGKPSGRKLRKKPNYAKLTQCGEDFSKCMKCGTDLPPNEQGSTAFRKVPECCDDCVWENA